MKGEDRAEQPKVFKRHHDDDDGFLVDLHPREEEEVTEGHGKEQAIAIIGSDGGGGKKYRPDPGLRGGETSGEHGPDRSGGNSGDRPEPPNPALQGSETSRAQGADKSGSNPVDRMNAPAPEEKKPDVPSVGQHIAENTVAAVANGILGYKETGSWQMGLIKGLETFVDPRTNSIGGAVSTGLDKVIEAKKHEQELKNSMKGSETSSACGRDRSGGNERSSSSEHSNDSDNSRSRAHQNGKSNS